MSLLSPYTTLQFPTVTNGQKDRYHTTKISEICYLIFRSLPDRFSDLYRRTT